MLAQRWSSHSRKAPQDKVMAELIAYAIAGHHAGLPDRIGSASSLNERLQRVDLKRLAPIWQTEITPVASDILPAFAARSPKKRACSACLSGRMLFSCFVDADFKDTEALL